VEQQTSILLGPQGCGKGTQAELLKESFMRRDPKRVTVHFEMGSALRSFGNEEGYTQALLAASLKRGELQPAFLTTHVIARFFIQAMRGDEHLIIDGYPRSLEQFADFDSLMRFYRREALTIFWIEISDKTALARLLARGRNDDTEESIRRRLGWTRREMSSVLAKLRELGYRVVEINGERPIPEVAADITAALSL